MAGKTGKKTGAGKAVSATRQDQEIPTPAQAQVVGVDLDITRGGGIGEFTDSRDDILSSAMPETLLPDSEEAFYARDPFSADYADFLKSKAEIRQEKASRVDEDLRANLLEKPFLMAKPEESTLRGAAAVWRSLRDQLKNESLQILDRSDPEELLMLQRELRARQMVLESVTKGVDGLIKRVEQRLSEGGPAPARAASSAGSGIGADTSTGDTPKTTSTSD